MPNPHTFIGDPFILGYHLSITFSISLGILGATLSATLGAISPYK